MGYPMGKESKLSRAQIEAHKRYDAKRAGRQVAIRLSEKELLVLDSARGKSTRAAYVLQAVRKSLGIK
jgi:hypothetical protein